MNIKCISERLLFKMMKMKLEVLHLKQLFIIFWKIFLRGSSQTSPWKVGPEPVHLPDGFMEMYQQVNYKNKEGTASQILWNGKYL